MTDRDISAKQPDGDSIDYDLLAQILGKDIDVIRAKNATYQDSWRRRGGVDSFMMLARKWDRIETMCKAEGFNIINAGSKYRGKYGEKIEQDGTLIAEIRDLRRYLAMVDEYLVRTTYRADRIGVDPGEPGSSYVNQG
jgi:hypothetical protein